MGEANRRGSKEQRTARAKAKADEFCPDKHKCSACKSSITDFERIDARSALGIDAAHFGFCAKCMLPFPLLEGHESTIKRYFDRYRERIDAQERVIKQREDDLALQLEDDLFWTSDDEPESDTQRIERYRATFRAVLKT